MCASCGMPEVMLSFPQIGPNVDRLLKLTTAYPQIKFATITDDHGHALHLSAAFAAANADCSDFAGVSIMTRSTPPSSAFSRTA